MGATAKYISFSSFGIVKGDTEEAEEILALADAIEVKLDGVITRLLSEGQYVVASSILDRMIQVTETLRHLVSNPGSQVET